MPLFLNSGAFQDTELPFWAVLPNQPVSLYHLGSEGKEYMIPKTVFLTEGGTSSL
jgi:hypothetical protein